ncbi:MAG: hypothetical protein MHM6MM_006172 [Cercozoa sp. M6MM]
MSAQMQFIDVGVNILDGMFRGNYRGRQRHEDDLDLVLERSWEHGCTHLIITAGTLSEAKEAVEFCKRDPERLFCTVGVHPTRCNEFIKHPGCASTEEYVEELRTLIRDNAYPNGPVVAVGECGLDRDREKFCKRDVQREGFKRHFALAKEFNLPMFLHCRGDGCYDEFLEIMREHADCTGAGACMHSFTGPLDAANDFVSLNELNFVSLNGCSLRHQENVNVAKQLPLDRVLLETDAPWCGVKRTHAGAQHIQTQFENTAKRPEQHTRGKLVKDRNEPCKIVQIFEVFCGIRGLAEEERRDFAQRAHKNTLRLFLPHHVR